MKPTTAQLVTKLSAYTVPAVLRDLLLQSRDAGIPNPKIINIPLLAQTYAVAVHVPLASLAHLSQEELTLVRSDLLSTASNYLRTVTHGHLHKRSSKYMTGVVSMAVTDSADGLY